MRVTTSLTKVESMLVTLAVRQRDSTVEAANAGFNSAMRVILETLPIEKGTVPELSEGANGLVTLTYEMDEASQVREQRDERPG